MSIRLIRQDTTASSSHVERFLILLHRPLDDMAPSATTIRAMTSIASGADIMRKSPEMQPPAARRSRAGHDTYAGRARRSCEP